jgi:hypothetical protein
LTTALNRDNIVVACHPVFVPFRSSPLRQEAISDGNPLAGDASMSEISAAKPGYSSADSDASGAVVSPGFRSNPWVQLVFGVVCMAMVANLQYGWTIFVNPIDARYHWGKAAIQVAFTLFILLETWLVPFAAASEPAWCMGRASVTR